MGRNRVKQTAVIIPDTHVPLHNKAALNCVYKTIKMVQPDMVMHLGDVGEWDSVSAWKYSKKKRPPLEYILKDLENDKKQVNAMLDELDHVCEIAGVQDKIVLMGNHEVWLNNFVEEHDKNELYLPQYKPENIMELQNRGWVWHKHGEYVTIGEISFYHGGHHAGVHHTRMHCINLGANVLYAHNHGVQRDSLASLRGVHAAFCIGCLKDCQGENNKWLKGKKMNWSHSFAIVYWNSDGTFRVEQIDITSGVTNVWGKWIDGN